MKFRCICGLLINGYIDTGAEMCPGCHRIWSIRESDFDGNEYAFHIETNGKVIYRKDRL